MSNGNGNSEFYEAIINGFVGFAKKMAQGCQGKTISLGLLNELANAGRWKNIPYETYGMFHNRTNWTKWKFDGEIWLFGFHYSIILHGVLYDIDNPNNYIRYDVFSYQLDHARQIDMIKAGITI